MKKNIKIGVLLFTVFAVSMIGKFCYTAVFASVSAFSRNEPIAISVETGDSVELVELWYSAERGIFFLPAYAELKNCSFVYDDTELKLCLDGKIVRSKKRLKNFNIDYEYMLSLSAKDNGDVVLELPIIFMKSENLPAVYLTTESGTLDYIYEDKENRETASMKIVNPNGRVIFQDEIETLKGHGNTTWKEEKKPYTLKLKQDEPLLGMDSGKKWILFANYFDESYLRNSIGLSLADMAGMRYTSQNRYVDLYINDEYKGNYQLTEKIEIGEGQVAIRNLEEENKKVNDENYKKNARFGEDDAVAKGVEDMVNPQDITGGYLLERNYGEKYENKVSGFTTEGGEEFVVRSPAYASREEIAYISSCVQSVENAIMSENGIDSVTGLYYTELLDIPSFVSKYVLEEIALNEANLSTSSWFYKPDNTVSTKLFGGPAWDYDKAFANYAYCMDPNVLSKMRCYYKSGDSTVWFSELYKKEEFFTEVKEQYRDRFIIGIEALLDTLIDKYADQIEKSVLMDQVRWKKSGDFREEVQNLKKWLEERKAFLNKIWLEDQEVYQIRYLQRERRKIENIESVFVGETAKKIPQIEDKSFLYWYVEEDDCIFEPGQKIDKDITLLPIYAETDD